MDITYKYQVAEKQTFGAPQPKKRKGNKPTNRISEGYANAIRASNTNGYVANVNMMSYKSGEDYIRHNQPRLNSVLNRLKNEPSTLNMNYYGSKVDPVEVRNYQYAKGADAYNATNRGELRFATYHAKDQNPFVAAAGPPPAYAGPHAADIGAEVGNVLGPRFDALQQEVRNLPQDIDQALGPRIQQMAPHPPAAVGGAVADALAQKGFLPHPLPQHQQLPLNPVLPAGLTGGTIPQPAWGGGALPSGIRSPQGVGAPPVTIGGVPLGSLGGSGAQRTLQFPQGTTSPPPLPPPPRPIPAPPQPHGRGGSPPIGGQPQGRGTGRGRGKK